MSPTETTREQLYKARDYWRRRAEQAEAELERLRRYATHMNYCASRNTGRESPVEANADCNCGLLEKP